MQKPAREGVRKPYSPPRLIVYGTVRDLTQAVLRGPTTDSGRSPFNHSTKVA